MQKTSTLLDKLPIFEIQRGSRLSIGLDLLRAIAALEVLISHIRSLYFVDYNEIKNQSNLLIKGFYFFTGFAHQAVIVFFVLSGLLIGNSVIKSFKQQRFTWKSYLIARLSRLWIVLIPALMLGLTWDLTGNFLSQGKSLVYLGNLGTNMLREPVTNTISLDIFLSNLFFLQSIYIWLPLGSNQLFSIPTLGSNGALWSLSHEFWYYIAFPVIILLFLNLKKIPNFIHYMTILLVLLFTLSMRSDPGFLVWLFGCSISLIPNKINLSKQYQSFSLSAALTFAIITLVAIKQNLTDSNADIILALAFSILIVVLSWQHGFTNENNIINKLTLWFSEFSYTIYLTHIPFLVFVLSLVVKHERWQPDPKHLFYGFVVFIITIIYSRIIYFFTEKNTSKLRNYVQSVI
jgi:peptidoglycan/LPS O-acetylase OafA/YrhL